MITTDQSGLTFLDNFFEEIVLNVLKEFTGIDNMQMAPKAIVSKIIPLTDNVGALGHDLLNDPKRRKDTLESIENGKLFFSGPLTLK